MTLTMTPLETLYQSLHQRKRPEDIAQVILELLDASLNRKQQAILQKAARGSLKQRAWAYTSMLQGFVQPVGLARQVATAGELFEVPPLPQNQCADPQAVECYLRQISQSIKKDVGQNDFQEHRLNHTARAAAGMDISRRRYNKLFRMLARIETKLQTLIREVKKLELTKVGKSGFGSQLSW